MALAALIAAYREAYEDGEQLRATLPLAGRTLVEHQARLAAHAGAEHVVILVERLPPALTAAVDRLRRDGLVVEVARNLSDAIDRIHPSETLLVIADGCVAGAGLVARMAGARVPAILTVPDRTDNMAHERIDGQARWGGMLLIDGERLRRAAEMLGDWDLESTLLRRAVQEGAGRISAADTAGAPALLIATDAATLAGVDRAMIAESGGRAGDWPARIIYPPIEKLAVPPLLARGVEPYWVATLALLLAIAAVALIHVGWPTTGYGALLLAGILGAIGDRLAAVRLTAIRHGGLLAKVRLAASVAALVALTNWLAPTHGWGCWMVAAMILLAMLGAAGEQGAIARLPGGVSARWSASAEALTWAMLPFALLGWWLAGLAALALYALLSFFALQREVLSRVAVYRGEA